MTLLPGPCSIYVGAPEERIAELLADPGGVRSIHRPVVALADGRCAGYEATVRVADFISRSTSPWLRAAALSGLSGQVGALSLQSALVARATLPGQRFLAVELDLPALSHPAVASVLAAEDDVSELVITLSWGQAGPGAGASEPARAALERLRQRGARVSLPAGTAGLEELLMLERLRPDLVRLPAELIRDGHRHAVRRGLIDVVLEQARSVGAQALAEDVESIQELAVLRSAGVDLAQGWLFGRARPGFVPPSPEVCAWLRSQPRR